MELKDIQELIKLINESDLTTMELEKEGFKLVLKKEKEQILAGQNGTIQSGQKNASPNSLQQPEKGNEQPSVQTINAPVVGTFYAAPSPGEAPFVCPGSRVKPGDTLCIIEAMKLMNEIEADEEVIILDVLVKDGEMVEYGQPLFTVEKPTG